jgi:O-antigen/teichoic acid export membrane protein
VEPACQQRDRDASPANLPPRDTRLRVSVSWTLCGNVVYAACQWGIVVAMAKLGTPTTVGAFAYATAFTAPILLFFNLQLRAVQATDAAGAFHFGSYLALRAITTIFAAAAIGVACLMTPTQEAGIAIILVIASAKCVESLSDVLFGLFQRHERMDLIATSMMAKGALSVISVSIVLAGTGSVTWACLGLAGSWFLVLIAFDVRWARRLLRPERLTAHFRVAQLLSLTKVALPLGIAMLLISLNTNIPRYFIQRSLGTYQLGVFAAVTYLLVAGTTVVSALGQSATPRLAGFATRGELPAFVRLVWRLLAVVSLVGLAGIVLAVVAGPSVLRLVYRSEYVTAAGVLVVSCVAATASFLASILGYALTAIRSYKAQAPLSAAVVGCTAVACWGLIPRYGLMGAAVAVLVSSSAQLAGLAWLLSRTVARRKVVACAQ